MYRGEHHQGKNCTLTLRAPTKLLRTGPPRTQAQLLGKTPGSSIERVLWRGEPRRGQRGQGHMRTDETVERGIAGNNAVAQVPLPGPAPIPEQLATRAVRERLRQVDRSVPVALLHGHHRPSSARAEEQGDGEALRGNGSALLHQCDWPPSQAAATPLGSRGGQGGGPVALAPLPAETSRDQIAAIDCLQVVRHC